MKALMAIVLIAVLVLFMGCLDTFYAIRRVNGATRNECKEEFCGKASDTVPNDDSTGCFDGGLLGRAADGSR